MGWCGAVKLNASLRQAGFGTMSRQNNSAPAEGPLASRSELSTFLEDVERRAFKQAVFAVRDQDAALDIVQDSMLRPACKYGNRPAAELPPLFHPISQTSI